jgi:hypothetical protein
VENPHDDKAAGEIDQAQHGAIGEMADHDAAAV